MKNAERHGQAPDQKDLEYIAKLDYQAEKGVKPTREHNS